MDGTVWKDLLAQLGCINNGRFTIPKDFREMTIIVSAYGGGVALLLDHGRHTGEEWSYTDDLIVHRDEKGRGTYYAWYGVMAVFTNPM